MKESYPVGSVVKARAAIKGPTDFVSTSSSNDTAAEAPTTGVPPRACITDPRSSPKLQLISEQDYDEEVRVVTRIRIGWAGLGLRGCPRVVMIELTGRTSTLTLTRVVACGERSGAPFDGSVVQRARVFVQHEEHSGSGERRAAGDAAQGSDAGAEAGGDGRAGELGIPTWQPNPNLVGVRK
jgi:hypothetical protein